MKRLVFCLGLAAGILPAAYSQSFPTNSNFRIEVAPGQLNPPNIGSPTPWYIEDYIDELTVPDDITLLNPEGNLFFTGNVGPPSGYLYSGRFFFDGLSDIDIDTGIVMGSGRVLYCGYLNSDPGLWPGIPHAAQYHSSGPQESSANCFAELSVFHVSRDTQYAELMAINNGDSIWDANVLDFDFVPKGNMIKLEYVFASEEFTRVDCNGPTDVMGIFLSGPGINGQQNIAVLPGTNTPVNPHTVWPANSPCHTENPAASPYYVDNTNGENVIYDGFTTVLTAAAYVNPCDTYHLRVAVADGALHPYDTTFIILVDGNYPDPFDSISNAGTGSVHGRMLYDSGIFLKSRSFRSTDSLWLEALGGTSLSSSYPYVVRGCLDGKIRIHSATAWPLDRELELVLSGDAVAGADYQVFNTTVMIPAGETSTELDIIALTGGSGTKTLQAVLKSPYGACSGLGDYLDTATLFISDGYYVSAEPKDTTICEGCSVQLRIMGEDFWDYSWSPTTGMDDPNSKEPIASPQVNTQYIVTATPPAGYPCSGGTDSVVVNIDPTGVEDMDSRDLKVRAYPNPNQGNFTVLIESPKGLSDLDYTLVDFLGRTIHQGSVKATGRVFKQKLHFPDLSSGVYSLQVRADGRETMRKISVYK